MSSASLVRIRRYLSVATCRWNRARQHTHRNRAVKAKILYAGVGIANALDYEKPVTKNEDYIINYNGIKEIS